MYLLPAVDLLDGNVVRLMGGDYAKSTVYSADPVTQAKAMEDEGAEWLHVVDLDGARMGGHGNLDVIAQIIRQTSLHVEVGGGIRSLDAARRMLDIGAERVIFGTALVKDPDLAQAAVEEFGDGSVVAGIDAKGGNVKIEGWLQGSELSALELAQKMADLGYVHLIYTDIARDGKQTGVAIADYAQMAEAFENPVIASGGVASLDDIAALAAAPGAIEAAVVGRAIYEGAFSVADAVAACKGSRSLAS